MEQFSREGYAPSIPTNRKNQFRVTYHEDISSRKEKIKKHQPIKINIIPLIIPVEWCKDIFDDPQIQLIHRGPILLTQYLALLRYILISIHLKY